MPIAAALSLPDPRQCLPAAWQPYALWLAAQAAPPLDWREHPFANEDEQQAARQAFAQHAGLPLDQYVRLARLAHLLGSDHADGARGEMGVFTLNTPLGLMLAVFSPAGLSLLEFPECKGVEAELRAVQASWRARFAWGLPAQAAAAQALQQELDAYFAGALRQFSTPLAPVGTPFQKKVWHTLQTIPYGATCSYKTQARRMGHPAAVRAVAAANGRNKISILIPCHRVIGSDGSLTGYGGGLARKRALLALEQARAA